MMRKAHIPGTDGFIGSHLTEMLLEKGYFVRALSSKNNIEHFADTLNWL
jgi:nucleoside-diphosphate-sugar epimerase